MKIIPVESTDYRLASAWYISYPLDAYALGPMRFEKPVDAVTVLERAEEQFSELPTAIWPDGRVIEVDEYPITIGECVEDDEG